MQATPIPSHPDAEPAPSTRSRRRTRRAVFFTLLLLFVAIAVLPQWINVSRFQQRIARNISSALGRPAYFDNVTLTLFPQPGFTLHNFILDEDPAFGYEPILRADQVQVTLRLTSLFRSHPEFSKISFSSPSVNLVYTNGRWNIESLLLQAAHSNAAPTAQRFAGSARRFPYIEATGARLNLKLDQEKSPFSLTDVDFALWLPEPHQWHLRLEAHPERTDSAPGDTGTIRAEGTLGEADRNASSSLAETPIDLHGEWSDAQLGGLSRLLAGRDPGLRGDFSLDFALRGTVGRNRITAKLKLADARRADFVPNHPLSLEASCDATSANTFRAFPAIQCHWPSSDSSASSDPALLALTASLPDATNIDSASATLTLPALPADTFFDWLSIATPHPPAVLPGTGILTGTLTWGTSNQIGPAITPGATGSGLNGPAEAIGHSAPEIGRDFSPGTNGPQSNRALAPGTSRPTTRPTPLLPPQSATLTGEIHFTGGSLVLDSATNRTLALGDLVLTSTPPPALPSTPSPARTPSLCHPAAKRRDLLFPTLTPRTPNPQPPTCDLPTPAPDTFTLQPLLLDLGGKQPATLTGHFDPSGYTLHLTGTALPATLRQAARAVPQFGDNLIPLLDQLSPDQSNLANTPTASPATATPLSQLSSSSEAEGSASAPDIPAAAAPAVPVGTPRLQPWVSQGPQKAGALAPGASLPSGPPPISIDLTATRTWGGPQTWTDTSPDR